MRTQDYLKLRDRQMEELNKFPIAYAFDEKQLKEVLEKLGATKEECVTIFGHGGYREERKYKEICRYVKTSYRRSERSITRQRLRLGSVPL